MSKLFDTCSACGLPLNDPHGNRDYHEDCGYAEKKERSRQQYATNCLKINPLWYNEKILRTFFKRYKNGLEVNPGDLEAAGFDFKLYSEEKNVKGSIIFCMRKFGFSFLQNKKIIIWKL